MDEKRKSLKCMICDASFTGKSSLKTHIASVHEEKKPFKCIICDDSFAESGKLKTHNASVHENNKPHKYIICDASLQIVLCINSKDVYAINSFLINYVL